MGSSVRNPFVFECPVVPSKFIGRKMEIDRVMDRVTGQTHGSVAIVGERRIGKSSLLHYVSSPDVVQLWNQDGLKSLFTFIDCGSISRFSVTGFWKTVLRKLQRTLSRNTTSGELARNVDTLLKQCDIQVQDIEFLLDDLSAEGYFWVVLLDEFEWLIRLDVENEGTTRDLLGGLRSLMNHVQRVFSLVVATRQPLHEICREIRFMGSPFYNSFVYVQLRPFRDEEVDSLIEQMLEGTHVSYSAKERSFLLELAGKHPLLLQTAAYCLFNAKAKTANDDSPNLESIRDQYANLVEHQSEDLWRWSQPREKLLLMAFALGDPSATEWLTRWTYERQSLVNRALVREDANPAPNLFSGVFSQWLIANDYRLVDDGFKNWAVENGHRQWLIEWSYLSLASSTDRGGKASKGTTAGRPVIFISYSHQDKDYKDHLVKHLRVLENAELIENTWSDEQIRPGEDWEVRIGEAMTRANLAILLISPDALSSSFICNQEIPELLRRRERNGLNVVPVIVRPCAWKKVSWLRQMQVRPSEGRPLSRDRDMYLDEDLAIIAEEVATLLTGA